nr:MAG TPA: zinc-ribbon containing domain protein [Caudoviricetes sp.]
MTENEAIERIKTGICCEKGTARYCTDACMYGKEKCAYSVAIKALKEIQQYRELEKRLTGMFGGELSLETVVDELERQLKEPDNPHPINAKILTYEDAAAWDAYRAIGTPEECQAAMEKQIPYKPSRKKLVWGIGKCKCGVEFLDRKTGFCGNCGQKLDWEDEE